MAMHVVEGLTANELFVGALALVLKDGHAIAPRGILTREVFPVTLCLHCARARIVSVSGRIINPSFAAAETLWILSGTDDPWIFDFNSRLRQYANEGRLAGAYGPRMRAFAGQVDQLTRARALLLEDPATRQAVVQMYDPASIRPDHRDIPCTIGFRFLLRAGRLHTFCTMRSQDVWLGLPYDLFFGTILQELMASWVGADPGDYYHMVDSMHLYESDVENARRVCASDHLADTEMQPLAFDWNDRERVIVDAIAGTLAADHPVAPLMVAMHSYRHWKERRREDAVAMASTVGGPFGRALERWYRHLARGSAGERPAVIGSGAE